ncbi:MAG TPA: GNAT family N-acetyltransferase, partial [Mycobacteriales bacterium]|nr:GNAT family N-acetyltransferase [Mycobacteriales bacterium]
MNLELRPIEPAEFPTFYRTMVETFGGEPHDDERELDRGVFEFERSLAGFDGGDLISTTSLFSREIALPGGTTTPVAAVTMVTVSPTHRRQGVLTAMMRRQLTDVYEGGRESVAALWASEATIYGRFGYGPATEQAAISGDTRAIGLPAPGPGRLRQLAVEEARPAMVKVHESVRAQSVGWLDRPGRWWDCQVF